jgi:hypothetical protein
MLSAIPPSLDSIHASNTYIHSVHTHTHKLPAVLHQKLTEFPRKANNQKSGHMSSLRQTVNRHTISIFLSKALPPCDPQCSYKGWALGKGLGSHL